MTPAELETAVHNALVASVHDALGGKLAGPLQEEHYASLAAAVGAAIYGRVADRVAELEEQNAELRCQRARLIEVGAQMARELEARELSERGALR